jgi:geranylgeranyl pyrophosphate synthase
MTLIGYHRIMNLKAGSLVAGACLAGCLVGGGDRMVCSLLTSFGLHLGISLQTANDIRSLRHLVGRKGDWRLGKRTLPVLFALRYPNDPRCRRFADLFQRQRNCVAGQEEMVRLLEEIGAFAFAEEVGKAELDLAGRRIHRLKRRGVDTSELERVVSSL